MSPLAQAPFVFTQESSLRFSLEAPALKAKPGRRFMLLTSAILFFMGVRLSEASAASAPITPEDYPNALRPIAQTLKGAAERNDKAQLERLVSELREGQFGRGTEDEQFFLIGYGLFLLGRYDDAASALEKSISLRESNPNAHYYLSLSHLKAGRCEKSLEELRGVKWLLGKENPDALVLQAECLAKLGRSEESSAIMSGLMTLASTNPEIKNFLLKAHANEHQLSVLQSTAGTVDLKAAALANPADANLQKMYGRSLLTKGDPLLATQELEEAQKIAMKAVELSRFQDEEAVKLLFDSLLKKGDFETAHELLEQASRAKPDSPVYSRAKKQLEIQQVGLRRLKFSTDSN